MDDGRGDSGRTESLRASEDLGDAENKLDDMIAKLIGLRIEVEDPDGLARFPLGDDGRLLTLFVDCAVRSSLTNLGLEKLNDLLSAGNRAVRLSRKEFWGIRTNLMSWCESHADRNLGPGQAREVACLQ